MTLSIHITFFFFVYTADQILNFDRTRGSALKNVFQEFEFDL